MKIRPPVERRYAKFVALLGLIVCFAGCSNFRGLSNSKSALWRVRGEHNVVYLLGSVHILPKSAYPLHPALEHAFADSQRVAFEVDIGRATGGRVRQAFSQVGTYHDGDDLSHHVSPLTLQIVKLACAELGVSYEKAKRFKPSLLAELMTLRYTELAGFREELGVDIYFYQRAKALKKPIFGLETISDQANVLVQNEKQGEQHLLFTIGSLPEYKIALGQMVEAWRKGQVDVLDQFLNQDERNDPEMFNRMFAKRNARWLPQIEKLTHQNYNCLVIVGAGHLVGSHGLIETLRQRGYRVDQL
ncbi:MAG TPA: TraB/GumN family protein [Chthoniobacterales bacterium]|nr:TraB/GumN family protein [Chthoniobacterales bacterium]